MFYNLLMNMSNGFGGYDDYYITSYRTDSRGEIFARVVHDGLAFMAKNYKSFDSAHEAAKKIAERDFRARYVRIVDSSKKVYEVLKKEDVK